MQNIIKIAVVTALILMTSNCITAIDKTPPTDAITIPYAGNAYITRRVAVEQAANEQRGRRGGSMTWKSGEMVISYYFRLEQAGDLDLYFKAKNIPANSEINVNVVGKTFKVKLTKADSLIVPIGSVKIKESGYVKVEVQGVSRKGDTFAEPDALIISGSATKSGVKYVADGFSFHFGRRGPSVHLNYPFPENETIEWFYNELTIPIGEDPIGSYFMSNGFGEGYFGIQVNSETERRVLFSVWSPFVTDNPKDIPETHKIKLLRKGENVNTGEFGNEGSGGQSFMRYNWKAGTTYRFLTHIRPTGNGSTIYTAYFYAADEERWMLIAEFERPLTDTYYKRAHSFLENFSPNQGYITRQGHYGNQWALSKDGKWFELTKAKFTADQTARQEQRQDYKGGVTTQGDFFMQNCGFFNDFTKIGSEFERPAKGKQPQIDFSKLP